MMNPAEFDNIAQAEEDSWWYTGMRHTLSHLMAPILSRRKVNAVLEAGCGTGYNARRLQECHGWRVFPLDLQVQGLQYARRLGLKQLTRGDVTGLPFRSEAFDAVISLDVLVDLRPGDEDRALAEFSRVLAPGGLLILRAAAFDFLRSRHSEFIDEKQRFTLKRLLALTAKHGVCMLRCTYANTLLFPIAVMKFRVWEPLIGGPPQSGVWPANRCLNRLLKLVLSIEGRLLASGLNFPFGQSLIFIGEKIACKAV